MGESTSLKLQLAWPCYCCTNNDKTDREEPCLECKNNLRKGEQNNFDPILNPIKVEDEIIRRGRQ